MLSLNTQIIEVVQSLKLHNLRLSIRMVKQEDEDLLIENKIFSTKILGSSAI